MRQGIELCDARENDKGGTVVNTLFVERNTRSRLLLLKGIGRCGFGGRLTSYCRPFYNIFWRWEGNLVS